MQDAIEAGVNPAALVEPVNAALAERDAARAAPSTAAATDAITEAEGYAMIDSLADVGDSLNTAKPERLAELYSTLSLDVLYEPEDKIATVTIQPALRVNNNRVRRGT
ncbi:hypothetical protein [Thermocrispum municipale]|uniref:hypothetical protein n=1 Tax=Thermocrispum municipale TaxID=37926 RepID=UPI00048ACCE2|nr:hypothetical protein [Thermocrispum municipale]